MCVRRLSSCYHDNALCWQEASSPPQFYSDLSDSARDSAFLAKRTRFVSESSTGSTDTNDCLRFQVREPPAAAPARAPAPAPGSGLVTMRCRGSSNDPDTGERGRWSGLEPGWGWLGRGWTGTR